MNSNMIVTLFCIFMNIKYNIYGLYKTKTT